VRLIGHISGGSLIVTAPMLEGKLQIVREGVAYNVRMLLGSEVVGFTTKVLSSAVKPYPHLHLQYPDEVESINVRNASRVTVRLPVSVRNLSLPEPDRNLAVRASLNDLSHTGAGIVTQFKSIAKVGDVVNMDFQFELMAAQETVNINADVRRVLELGPGSQSQDRYFHGVEFRAVNRFQQIMLHAWTLERRADELGG
jgi:c-di-GMP-binding flagellar brake protein YcgR